jgi:Ca2+-binding RTX toxin-like protein
MVAASSMAALSGAENTSGQSQGYRQSSAIPAPPRWNDTLRGSSGDDLLNGQKGNDILYGGGGSDRLNGGGGEDILFGGDGNDTFTGGRGDNFLGGESGNDTFLLVPGRGFGVISGGPGLILSHSPMQPALSRGKRTSQPVTIMEASKKSLGHVMTIPS